MIEILAQAVDRPQHRHAVDEGARELGRVVVKPAQVQSRPWRAAKTLDDLAAELSRANDAYVAQVVAAPTQIAQRYPQREPHDRLHEKAAGKPQRHPNTRIQIARFGDEHEKDTDGEQGEPA